MLINVGHLSEEPLLQLAHRICILWKKDTAKQNLTHMCSCVHQEKLEQQEKTDDVLFSKIDHLHKDLHQKTDEIKTGCERDILLVKNQIEAVEKKIYIAAGAIAAFVFVGHPAAQKFLVPLLSAEGGAKIERSVPVTDELSRPPIRVAVVPAAPKLR